MSEPLDKSTVAPRVTWGFAFLIAAGLIAASIFWQQMSDVARRQQVYIERRNTQHAQQQDEIDELREIIHSLELSFTEQHGERPR